MAKEYVVFGKYYQSEKALERAQRKDTDYGYWYEDENGERVDFVSYWDYAKQFIKVREVGEWETYNG